MAAIMVPEAIPPRARVTPCLLPAAQPPNTAATDKELEYLEHDAVGDEPHRDGLVQQSRGRVVDEGDVELASRDDDDWGGRAAGL